MRWLARKRLPVREAIALAVQMAEALEAAHEKGIIPSRVAVEFA